MKRQKKAPVKWDLARVCTEIEAATPPSLIEGKRVLVITPDATRSAPLPLLIRAVQRVFGARTEKLDYMVALGTHPVMTSRAIRELFGISPTDEKNEFSDSVFLNHRWDLNDTLVKIGHFSEKEISDITDGLFSEAIDVTINKAIFDYDLIVIVGPVFPHEIVGFSGGHKYLFPGISGGEFLDFFHWLSAVISCRKTIGHRDTPARAVVEKAAGMVSVPRHLIAMVVAPGGDLEGLYVGHPETAWPKAVTHSQEIHIVRKPKHFHTVFGYAPTMYDEIWVGGKVMYKLEPVVADGGTLIIYGPHINKISQTWGRYIEQIGYHVADYFVKQMHKFEDVPRGVLAHSALVKGEGTYINKIERPRINVALATGVSANLCRQINLDYIDPSTLKFSDYKDREEEGILFVDHAGETLHLIDE